MIDASAAIAVQEEVSARLVALGWARLEPASPNPMFRYALFLPGEAEILPATWLMPRLGEHGGQALIEVAALVGLECPAARELTTALVGRAYSGVVLRSPQLAVPPTNGGGAAKAVEALVKFVVAQPSALSTTDADAVIELLNRGEALPATNPSAAIETDEPQSPHQDRSTTVAVAILAALGRYGDAGALLASLGPIVGAEDLTRFVCQIGRWIDAAGRLPLPTSPAQWGPAQLVSPSEEPQSRSWSEHRANGLAEQGAVAAVRAIGRGKDRRELRTLLENELHARGLQLQRSAVEKHLDFLLSTQSTLGTARTVIRGIRGIADLVKDAGSRAGPLESVLAHDPGNDQHDVLEGMRPARATYPVAPIGEENVVGIDPKAAHHIQDLMRGRREVGVCIWFNVDDESTVAVHIGPHRVAQLPDSTGQRFAAPIAAAAERGELPWMDASLSDGPSGLELHLALPALPVPD